MSRIICWCYYTKKHIIKFYEKFVKSFNNYYFNLYFNLFSIKYLSIKNNYITIKIIYNSACVIDKQIDSKLISLIGDDIDIDLIKPHCEDGFRRNHRGFIINKNKLDTLLELINEVDLNLHAQQIIESSINRNNKILKLFDKNLLYTLEDPSLDMSNISSQLNKFISKTLKENNELKFAKKITKHYLKSLKLMNKKRLIILIRK